MNRPLPPLPPNPTESPVAAAREDAITQITRTVFGLALISLIVLLAVRPEDILTIALLLAVFTVFSGMLAFNQEMSYRLRSALFILLFFGTGVGSLYVLGIGGSGELFLLAFAILATFFFGALAGGIAAGLAVLTWFGAGVLFSQFNVHPL